MTTINKYTLRAPWLTRLSLPVGAPLLTAQYQDGALVAWAQVETEAECGDRWVEVVGTGWQIDGALRRYVSTVQDAQTGYVWHVYEVTR